MPRFFAVDAAAAKHIKTNKRAEAQRRRDNNKTEEAQRRRELFTCTRLVFC